MPSDALTVAVTTGLGVSVFAGILSGICYILTQGLPRTRNRRPRSPWNCNVCGGQFRSIQGVLEVEKVVTCAKCREKVCRIKCSHRDPLRGWICQVCQQPETWFKGLLKAIHPHKGWYRTSMNADTIEELDEDLLELRKKEREQVRDFIERLVESMLGGNLDEVNVSRIYNDKKYLPITGQSPCSAHASLKQLIQRFITEAVDLPELKKKLDHPALPEETQDDRTYEDLLSTAIINKVVQNYQNETSRSSTASFGSRASSSKKKHEKEYFFSEETLDTKWKNHDTNHDDSSSISSVEDWAKSDSSVSSSKYVDRVSLTIKQRIDEDTTSEGETSDNAVSIEKNTLLQSDDAWNENWYLQKRVLGTNSPVPVPMLVPNPTTEAKVLIGDREAEDTSDLSDAASDFGDHEVVPDIKNILVNSRTIIGGKNLIENVENGDITEDIRLISDIDITDTNNDSPVSIENELEEMKNDLLDLEDHTQKPEIVNDVEIKTEDALLFSLDSNTEQDTEYTEQYASLPRTILKSPKPTPRTSKMSEIVNLFEVNNKETENTEEKSDENLDHLLDQTTNETDDEDDDLHIFKGSYSEREKEKWKHAVEIPNNPYSPENLERRLSYKSSNGSFNSLFDRDYYIKEAAKSAGSRKLLNNKFISEANGDYSNEDKTEEAIKINGNSGLVKAIPALVDSEDSIPFILSSEMLPIVSSDSDMSIERIYNLESGKVIQKIGAESEEYTLQFGQQSSLMDENHNTYNINEKKLEFMRSLTQNDEISQNEINDVVDAPNISIPYFNEEQPLVNNVDVKIEDDQSVIVPYLKTEEIIRFNSILQDNQKNLNNFDNKIEQKNFGEVKNYVENKMTTSTESSSFYVDNMNTQNKEFSLEYSVDFTEDDTQSRPESSLDTDPEIIELKTKCVVRDVLGKFSKSYPNLSAISIKKLDEVKRTESVDEGLKVNGSTVYDEENFEVPSVSTLKKIFDKEIEAKQIKNQVHSLTARSISKQFRQELKSYEENINNTEESLQSGLQTETEDLSELPADIAKKGIAYFENLGKGNNHKYK